MRPTSLLTLTLLARAVSNSAAARPRRRLPPPAVMVHGGAGSIENWEYDGLYNGTRKAARAAYNVVQTGAEAWEAVVEAIMVMEDDPSFNAGRGGALTMTGHVETDASIMYGRSWGSAAGTVASITGIKNPIKAAELVMKTTPHVQLAGDKASVWLANQGLDTEDESYFITEHQYLKWLEWLDDHGFEKPKNATNPEDGSFLALNAEERKEFLKLNGDFHLGPYPVPQKNKEKWYSMFGGKKTGTVGAVVLDAHGDFAAGTSTGGWVGKMPGRVGDTPGIGHGVYADSKGAAVSCTGNGEAFMITGVARLVSLGVEKMELPTSDAIKEALSYMAERTEGEGGVIAISNDGEMGIGFNSDQMAWAYARDGILHYGVDVGEDFHEEV